jgi:capsular exopolysaccharide synthesis family protein
MGPMDYLRILRRRWWIVALGLVLGLMLAFVTQPSAQSVAIQTAPTITWRATNNVLANSDSLTRSSSTISWDRLALYTIKGEVAQNAVKALDGTAWPDIIDKNSSTDNSTDSTQNSAQRKRVKSADASVINFRQGRGTIRILGPKFLLDVTALPDPSVNGLAIVATSTREIAPKAADVFAAELIKYVDKLAVNDFNKQKADLQNQQLATLTTQASLDQQIALAGANAPLVNALQQRRVDADRRLIELNTQMSTLDRQGPQTGQLASLEPATKGQIQQIRAPGGSAVSSSQRMILGGAIGALIGLVVLVVMELLGARIRDVQGTEGAARMPVIAEIPVVKINRADRFVVATAADPASLTAEAYRSMRTSLLAMWQRHPRNTPLEPAAAGAAAPTPGASRGRPLRTLLVTSPGPAEGKSISVVNLAAAFAETGVSVIVIDSDFRRPTQYRYLDRPRNPNLGDLDLTCTPDDLEAVLQDTEVPGVRLAASAPTRSDPGHAIAVAKSAVRAAEQIADIVIVDSPPLLLANDASDLALSVDATILLARSGWTRRSGVTASAELLRRLEVPVIGIVIVGAEHGVRAGYYGYYGYYGYGYGYAHPGEVSLVSRLKPWKSHKKQSGGRPVPTGASAPSAPRVPPTPPVSTPPDADDPWV